MTRAKAKTRHSEGESYSLNALHSVPESLHLIFSKWKRLRVGAELPVVAEDECDS